MIEYIVTGNDTLKKIADYYQVSVEDLKKINNLSDDNIEEGMILLIPYDVKTEYYTVLKGDDLYSIAKKFDISVEFLARLNGLKVGEYIYPGQSLIVPKEGYNIYITNNGDTILGIHNELKVPIENLINGNPNLYLLPDQLIIYEK